MGNSPFPYLDVFVESLASIGNIPGKIRSWYWFSEYALMVYNMSRNRFCERIGRQHKSNHVIYVVDLRRNVYYQKCHDPDCRGYRSPLRPVPDNVIPHSSISVNLPGHNLDEEKPTVTSDKSISSSCKKEWWLEAVRVADSIENVQKALDLTEDGTCEDEEEWWMAVEKIAHQTELSYFGKA
ncbi:putative solute carrier family 25 member 39-like [Capsicum annuum]|nr:putative solute carrier family 25 member 39-like [Capsicum annuum]